MSKKVGWSFWWLWLFANIVGGVLLPIVVWQDPYDLRSRVFLNEILQSIGVATAQSIVLGDRYSKHSKQGWWLPLTLCGWIIGLSIVFLVPPLSLRSQLPNLPFLTSSLAILFIDFFIIGAIVGICQWQLLKSFRDGRLWILTSAIALALSTFGLYLGYLAKSTVLAIALQGAIYGAITGLAAIKVLRSPKNHRR